MHAQAIRYNIQATCAEKRRVYCQAQPKPVRPTQSGLSTDVKNPARSCLKRTYSVSSFAVVRPCRNAAVCVSCVTPSSMLDHLNVKVFAIVVAVLSELLIHKLLGCCGVERHAVVAVPGSDRSRQLRRQL